MHRTEQKCDLLRVLFLGHADNPLVRETAASLRSQIELDAKIVLEDFDGSADLSAVEADLAVVFDLQPVYGAVVIGDFINLQGAIAVPHDILEQCLRHADRKPVTQSFGNDRLVNCAEGLL